MALYVYITEDCRTIAQKHNCLKEVESLKKRVEEAQRLCHFDNFPPPYLKKRFKRQIRLLGDFQSIRIDETDHTVVCLLTIILRGSPDYEKFLKDPVGYGEKHLKPLVAENEIESFLDACLQEQPIAPLPEPSDSEYGYLYELLGSGQNNSTDEIIV